MQEDRSAVLEAARNALNGVRAMECSALTGEGVPELFEAALELGFKFKEKLNGELPNSKKPFAKETQLVDKVKEFEKSCVIQ